MKTYCIAFRDSSGKVNFSDVPRPDNLPEPGQLLIVEKPFVTRAGFFYWRGDKLKLLKRTTNYPFNLLSSLGNWEVRCPYWTSIWTNIELMIAEGTLIVESG